MPNNKIPARLLPAVYQGRRPLGGPNTTTRHSMLKDIEKIIPEVDNKGSFSSWAYIAHDKLAWSILGSNNFKPTPEWDGNTPDSPNFQFSFSFYLLKEQNSSNSTTSSYLSSPFSLFFSDI